MKPVYEIGEIVKIIDDKNGHLFEIGQRVRIRKLNEDGSVDSAESLEDSQDYWYLNEDDIEKIEE
ncbi:hypothetical protein PQE66_gp169 [Bacillus phage PBC2]|uniref:Uncharacterized protein n=1 Tax=Bacillus phage PBC2 TaxID=1675029 RepID=A0A218KC70_9CAUD|nr:hypothetical protein PQE66_gp169 [Bacillus phage PBC2]AKQ08484.1 hypothetical protein PBC2_169 [Bacillus phage PBC2]